MRSLYLPPVALSQAARDHVDALRGAHPGLLGDRAGSGRRLLGEFLRAGRERPGRGGGLVGQLGCAGR